MFMYVSSCVACLCVGVGWRMDDQGSRVAEGCELRAERDR